MHTPTEFSNSSSTSTLTAGTTPKLYRTGSMCHGSHIIMPLHAVCAPIYLTSRRIAWSTGVSNANSVRSVQYTFITLSRHLIGVLFELCLFLSFLPFLTFSTFFCPV